MKYYISNLKICDVKKMDILNRCIKIVDIYLLIFSLDGIFEINQNSNTKSIKKIINNDAEIKTIKINETYLLLQDNSQQIYVDSFQIPYNHAHIKIRKETYSMRENTPLKFVIVKNDINEDIIDFYFYMDTNDSITNSFIHEDIITFLSTNHI